MTIPIIRNSERGDFLTCPSKWNWAWNEGLVPSTPLQNAAWFGSCWHVVWAEVYTPPPGKDGFTRAEVDPHDVWDRILNDAYVTVSGAPYFQEDDEKEFYNAQALGHVMIDGQIKQWNLDPAFEVISPEHRFTVNIPFNLRQRGPTLHRLAADGTVPVKYIARLVGTFDMAGFDHSSGKRKPTLIDWKTTNRKENLKQMNKDNQGGTYLSVANNFFRKTGVIDDTESFDQIVFSFARKAMPPDPATVDENGRIRNQPQVIHYTDALMATDKFSMADLKGLKKPELAAIAAKAGLKVYGEISKNQGAQLFWREAVRRNKANRQRQISRIADDAEVMASVRAGILPVLKNPDQHCNWCQFNDLCDIDEDGGDTEDFKKHMFRVEDRYADHREGAVNSKISASAKKETGIW